MKKIGVFCSISADGFCAGPNGEMDGFPHSTESTKFSEEHSSSSDTLIFGHITYKLMESFWPTPAAEKMGPVTAENMRKNQKIVFSRTLQKVEDRSNWKNVKVLHEINPVEIVKLKEQSEKGIVILGSASIVRQFTDLGLIDEYEFMVYPVVFGKGLSLFKDVKRTALKLLDTRIFDNGNVLLSYETIRKDAK